MISVKTAEYYTASQRKQLCEWCRSQGGKRSCPKCGITQTLPRKEKIRGSRDKGQ